jgi:hypothetical protein
MSSLVARQLSENFEPSIRANHSRDEFTIAASVSAALAKPAKTQTTAAPQRNFRIRIKFIVPLSPAQQAHIDSQVAAHRFMFR